MAKRKTMYHPPDKSRETALTGLPLASFTKRALALLIDFLAAGILFVAVVLAILFIGKQTGIMALYPDVDIEFRFFENWYSIIWLVIYFTLSKYFSNGRTIGKKIFRIRIVSLVHERIGLWHAFERSLGYGASALEFGFGFFQYFIRPDRRTIHDRIAETIVIDEPAKEKEPTPEEEKDEQ